MPLDFLGPSKPKKKPAKKKRRKQTRKLKTQRAKTIKKNALKGRKIKVSLRRSYFIGGNTYGPGIMVLPIETANVLQGLEDQLDRNEMRLMGTRSMVIGPRGPTGHTTKQMPDGMYKNPNWPNMIPEESFIPKGG